MKFNKIQLKANAGKYWKNKDITLGSVFIFCAMSMAGVKEERIKCRQSDRSKGNMSENSIVCPENLLI